MGNKKWTRLLALILAVVCTFTVVAAAGTFQDMNGDGKYTVWDLQALFAADSENYEATLEKVLGGKDELNPKTVDGETVYYIASELGLRNMVKNANKGYTFELVNDIDLGGMDWMPVSSFKGTFNGNDHTISNFKITKSSGINMGFFADTLNEDNENDRTSINELHLEGVDITVNSSAQFVGAVVGTNRSDLVNCTAVSTVTDLRTTLPRSMYYGALAGRNTNYTPEGSTTQTACGKIDGSNELATDVNITKESTDFKNPGHTVNSKMATYFGTLSYPEGTETEYSRAVGIAGNSRSDGILNENLLWQDITNSTDLVGEDLQARREAVAAEMYEMCTVEWTPSSTYAASFDGSTLKELRYYNYDQSDTKWYDSIPYVETRYFADQFWLDSDGDGKTENYSGGVYRGFPYNHGSSGMDRFLAMMDEGANGIYTTSAELPDTAYYLVDQDMIDAINKAYTELKGTADSYTVPAGKTITFNGVEIPLPEGMSETITNTYSQLGFNMYIGADCSSQAAWAWRKMSAVTDTGFANVLGTGEMFPTYGNGNAATDNITKYGIVPVNGMTFDYAATTTDKNAVMSARLEEDMAANNGKAVYFWDTLALTSKGDLLMEYSPAGGHTRLALSDAVVIRKWNGEVDPDLSYIVTAEQGGSGTDSDGINRYFDVTAETPWRSSCCVDRRMTFADLTTNTMSDTYGTYLCWVPITCDALRNEESTAGKVTVSATAAGVVSSNFHIVSTTINGETEYTGIAQSGHRNPVTKVTLSSEIAAGTQVTVRLANGKDYTFTYGTAYSYSES